MRLLRQHIAPTVSRALAEDLGMGDVTTDALIPVGLQGKAVITPKAGGVLAGIDVAAEVFRQVDPQLRFETLIADGAKLKAGDAIATIVGSVAGILGAERVALNFLQRLSGIATETSRYVEAVAGTGARVLDTRKTVPGLRLLDKYAVLAGGGSNHRQNLGDGLLIKDNHLATLRGLGVGLGTAVRNARQNAPHVMRVEVEVETFDEALEALDAGADILLLDNMGLEEMRLVVAAARGRALTEASGGITLHTVRAVAQTGVDYISVGALTHSARAMDISLELETTDPEQQGPMPSA